VAGILSAAMYGLLSYEIRASADIIPATEIVFIRSLSATCFFLPAAVRDRQKLISTESVPLWVRSIAATVAIVCFTWNLQHTSVALATALFNGAPLFIALLAIRFSNPTTIKMLLDALLVVSGIFIFWTYPSLHTSSFVLLVGIVGAGAAALSGIALKAATKSWSADSLTWGLSVMGVPILGFADTGHWALLTRQNSPIFVAICVLSLLSQVLLVRSFKFLSTTAASSLGSTTIAFGTFCDVAMGNFSGTRGLIGCTAYLLGMIHMIHLETRQAAPISRRSKFPA
jgi:drug/metabolite transporter (DMT)-like permease